MPETKRNKLEIGVWYSEGTTVYRLKHQMKNGIGRYERDGSPMLCNETTIRVDGPNAERLAEDIAFLLRAQDNWRDAE